MKNLFLLSFAAIFLMSCEKEPDSHLNQDLNDFLPLQIGNYWVYQNVFIDSMNHETLKEQIDSIRIDRDTLINGYRFFILEGTNYPYNGTSWGIVDIIRDSMGYIVNSDGAIKFSDVNFTDILNSKIEVHKEDTLYILSYKMDAEVYHCSVPAGQFEALNYKGTVVSYMDIPGIRNPRYLNTLYSRGVGKIKQSYFYLSSPNVGEKRLIRYHIEP